ncbi:MAG: hypothetical protein K1X35_01960 [Caulobacteraceae bacterium]|nr:hypothetical protein [Caulobacteraceae bacterium]
MSARGRTPPILTVLALLGGVSGLGGCLAHDPFAMPADPKSAAAQQVNEAAARDRPFPRWSEFPAAPQNVPTAEDFRMRVVETEEAQRILAAQAAQLQWELENTEAWAQASRSLVDADLAQPAPADAARQTEAWAAAARAQAVPPPVAK